MILMYRYNKIHILGAPGSGKTHLAGLISKKMNTNHYNLDKVYWNENFRLRNNPEAREKLLNQALSERTWVIEGAYTQEWIMPSIHTADLIIILIPKKSLRLYRLIVRNMVRIYRGNSTFSQAIKLIYWGVKYDKTLLGPMLNRISDRGSKEFVILSSKNL